MLQHMTVHGSEWQYITVHQFLRQDAAQLAHLKYSVHIPHGCYVAGLPNCWFEPDTKPFCAETDVSASSSHQCSAKLVCDTNVGRPDAPTRSIR